MIALASLAPRDAFAAHPCWIDHASEDAGKIRVYFSPHASLNAILEEEGSKELSRYTVSGSRVRQGQESSAYLVVSDRSTVYLRQGPEDTCTLRGVYEAGRVGIVVDATNDLPGTGRATANAFIRARPRDDNPGAETHD